MRGGNRLGADLLGNDLLIELDIVERVLSLRVYDAAYHLLPVQRECVFDIETMKMHGRGMHLINDEADRTGVTVTVGFRKCVWAEWDL